MSVPSNYDRAHEAAVWWLGRARECIRLSRRFAEWRRAWIVEARNCLREALVERARAERWRPVSSADAEQAANDLVGQPIGSHVSRAFGEVGRG